MKKHFAIATIGLALAIISSNVLSGDDHNHHDKLGGLDRGACVLVPTKGNDVRGVVSFKEHNGVVHLTGTVMGLTPGKHGFHIHEYGDVRCTTGDTAGWHYNPKGHKHAGPTSEKRHAGDLGNIVANDNGVASVNVKIKGVPLHFLFGRSLVVHAGPDDLESQPSGNAGARVAFGVIGIAHPGS